MENIPLSPEMLAVIPGIVLLLQLMKQVPAIAKISVWMPLISIGIGIVYAVLAKMGGTVLAQAVTGVLMGIAASGGYDALKTIGTSPSK